jgi:AcrR family transcriptional regulator
MPEAREPARSRNVAKIHEAAIKLFAERGADEITVSDLAAAAGVARGTIYNNIERPEELFGVVASDLAHHMYAQITASSVGVNDPAMRVAIGARMFIRRAHEEPHWGRFIVRFAVSHNVLRRLMEEPPQRDIANGIRTGRLKIAPGQLPAAVAVVGGSVLAGMQSVLDGDQTWREASADIAELVMRSLGVDHDEARMIACAELPPLSTAATKTGRRRTKGRTS